MSEKPKFFLRFVAVMLVLAGLGFGRYSVVHSLQERLVSRVGTALDRVMSLALDPSADSRGFPARLGRDATDIQRDKIRLAAAGSLSAVLFGVCVFGSCVWASNASGHFGLTAVMGTWGWFVGGFTAAAIARGGYTMIGTMQRWIAPQLPQALPGAIPFSALLVLGLLASVVWQGLVPWILGWFAGSRIREWRLVSLPFDAHHYGEIPAATVHERVVCACGTRNLVSEANCYACGADLAPLKEGA